MNNNEENFTCQYCGEVCKNKMSKVRHEWLCKKNPDYEKHLAIHRNTTVKASKSKEVLDRIKSKLESNRERFLEEHPDEAYQDFELTCKKCGKKFIRNLKVRHFKNNYRVPQFCCTEHAHSRVHTKESRNKVSKSVKKERLHKCPKCGKEFIHRGTSVNQTFCNECFLKHFGYERGSKIKRRTHKENSRLPTRSTNLHSKKCPICGKTIWVKTAHDAHCYDCCDKMNKYHYQLYTKDGKRILQPKTIEKIKKIKRIQVKSGKHRGWQSRNIKSYPEIFWENVLNNNGIDFIRERCVNGYFLDFVLRKGNKEIDLEIDGKQHKYEDRKIHDKKRDKNLRETGYIVYRIDWNEINSKRGSLKMKAKIRQFLWWLEHQ